MPNVTLRINRLNINDCADDDEDMRIGLRCAAIKADGSVQQVIEIFQDVHVEEEGKIGNDSRCVFFGGIQSEQIADVAEIQMLVNLQTRDSDGYDWGGYFVVGKHFKFHAPASYLHKKDVANLAPGVYDHNENQGNGVFQAIIPGTKGQKQGTYTFEYTIQVH
jgi:hypothetical protein